MALALELCFYVGVALSLLGLFGILICSIKARTKVPAAICVLLVGILLAIGPGIVTRAVSVDLGPRDAIVDGERHLTLKGWDGEDYEFLSDQSDIVVLQMGNPDVTDSTIDLILGNDQLRELDLNDSKVTDASLSKIQSLKNLVTLRLRGTKITDEGFRSTLMQFESLMQLDVRETEISEALITEWKDSKEGRRAFQ